MTDPRTLNRRPSSQRQEEVNDLEDSAELLLSRTKSQEITFGDGLVQQLTPEITRSRSNQDGVDSAAIWPHSVRYWVYLCAFITSLAFGTTQVPLLYAFRLMTCSAYYESHPASTFGQSLSSASAGPTKSVFSYWLSVSSSPANVIEASKDRCSMPEIEASTSLAYAICGGGTTLFGIVNLFITGSLIKRIGVKQTLFINTFFPAVRLLIQNVGMEVWGNAGIITIQASQMVSVVGGPSGYMLALNTYVSEVVEYEGRTGALGRLQGGMLFGSALGFLTGGLIADPFGIKAPFRLTLLLFCISSLYVLVALPYIQPDKGAKLKQNLSSKTKKGGGISRYLGPLAVFVPRKFVHKDGVVKREYGSLLLAWSVFLGILASGYLQTVLQMYATDIFGFGTTENGWLIFMYSTLRGTFLTFAFPKLIAAGRKIMLRREEAARNTTTATANANESTDPEREPLLADTRDTTTSTPPLKPSTVPPPSTPLKTDQKFTFDLVYTRFSLIADGVLTLLCMFVREGWQMYMMAAILPFAAGTGSAAKGTILQMVGSSASSSERSDALAGVSLVESIARLSTTFVFGVVFAAFANMGRQELVFTCNAAAALLGFVVMCFARFPPEGSRRLECDEIDNSTEPERDANTTS